MYRWINITPLNFAEKHGDEIAEDLQELYQKKAIDSAAFSLTFTPEGSPVIDKAADYMKRFRIMKEKLHGKVPVGALLQATMGHGWTPNSKADFPKFMNRNGEEYYIFCPLDPGFRKYVYDSVRKVALERPDFFMMDDDTRLITGRGGCFCKLHLEEFGRRTGRRWSREELVKAIENDPVIARQYDDLLKDSILIHARTVREAIDSVDPKIPCLFCTCSQDVRHAPDIARALAAPGQELVVRINNARYLYDSPRCFADWFYFTAAQVAAFPEDITLLAEPDTYPQNIYATSCAVMNAQITASLLLGCRGGKIWITRLASWEPGSGKNYRKLLAGNAGFYHTLADIKIRWTAPYVPMPEEPSFNISDTIPYPSTWAGIFSRMGIPFSFELISNVLPDALKRSLESHSGAFSMVTLCGSHTQTTGNGLRKDHSQIISPNTFEISSFDRQTDRVTLLGAGDTDGLSDAELKRILSGKVLLDGTSAVKLTKRGFADMIGCNAVDWSKDCVTEEILPDGGIIAGDGNGVRADLSDLKPGTEVLSTCCHKAYVLSDAAEKLSPGTIYYKNSSGGEIIICGKSTLLGGTFGIAPFVMFCETRKRFLVDCLNRLAPLDLYIPEEAEIALMTGICADRRIFAVINLGLDPYRPALKGKWIEDLKGLEQLMPSGAWQPVKTELCSGMMTIQNELPALGTGIFRFC